MESSKKVQPKRRRLLYLDLLRGVLLVFIILNHSPFSPSLTDTLTGDGLLIASAAEGFFILSGLMIGLLYAPKIISGVKSVLKKIWSRAILLYVLSIITTLIFTLLGMVFIDPSNNENLWTGSLFSIEFLQQLLSLNYTYGWADFLTRYAVFMLTAPLPLLLIAYKKEWAALLLAALVWFVSPIIGMQSLSAWWILFVIGMVLGANLNKVNYFFDSSKTRPYLYLILAVSLLTLIWSWFTHLLYPSFIFHHVDSGIINLIYSTLYLPDPLYYILLDKETMGIFRIGISVLWFISALYIFRKFEGDIIDRTGKLLLFLGRNSLLVYVIHAFVIFLITSLYVLYVTDVSIIIATLINILILAFVYTLTVTYRSVEKMTKEKGINT